MRSVTQRIEADPALRVAAAISALANARRSAESRSRLGKANNRLLWLFTDLRPRTLKQIAEDLALEQSTANRQVNAALSAGILRRYRDPSSPAYLILATEGSLKEFETELREFQTLYDGALAALTPVEQKMFPSALTKFAAAFTEMLDDDLAP